MNHARAAWTCPELRKIFVVLSKGTWYEASDYGYSPMTIRFVWGVVVEIIRRVEDAILAAY